MFYCEACRIKNKWPGSFARLFSFEKCENCGKTAYCNDVASSRLPPFKNPCKEIADKFLSIGTVGFVDCCEQGHKFIKLPDHPHQEKDGHPRCPYCMSEELDAINGIRTKHEELMRTDPAYAEDFKFRSIPAGHRFSVSLESVDPYLTEQFFASMFSKDRKLVAGCLVHEIEYRDIHTKYRSLLTKLEILINEEKHGKRI